jgi:phospholipid transport system substrate-binding protein
MGTVPPDVLVRTVTNEVLSVLRNDKDVPTGSDQKAIELIETKVQQHFDFMRMARLAVGRDWKKANEVQRRQIADEFHTLLVRTYAKALTGFSDQTMKYRPFKMNRGATDVKVGVRVVQSGVAPVSLNYYLGKTPTGWQVYDIEAGGISLVINYRRTFADEIRNNGVEGLIKSLRAKNQDGVAEERN